MPIVTTSSRGRGKSQAASRKSVVLAIAAVAIIAFAAIYLGARAARPRNPSPAVSDTIVKPAPAATPTSAAQAATTSPPSGGATSAVSAEPTSPPQGGPTSSADAEPGPATNASVLPPRKTQRPTGFSGGPAEQLVAMMAGASDRRGMPPMPMSSEKALLKDLMVALTNDIVVYEDDTPETVAFKERVADFKNQLAKIVQIGGSITNAMKEYENWVNENKALRDAVIHEYMRLKAEASQEEADAYLAEANKELEAEGIETVNLGKERRRSRRPAESSQEQ